MKLGLWLRLLWIVCAYCGCGGSEFEGLGPPAPASSSTLLASDAGDVVDAQPDARSATSDTGSQRKVAHHEDAGELVDAASIEGDSPSPAADSAGLPPQADGAEEAPPPPPALCCATPCSGSSPAAITCGNGSAWTCAEGSCSDRACAVGAACMWMGTCVGRVEVCP